MIYTLMRIERVRLLNCTLLLIREQVDLMSIVEAFKERAIHWNPLRLLAKSAWTMSLRAIRMQSYRCALQIFQRYYLDAAWDIAYPKHIFLPSFLLISVYMQKKDNQIASTSVNEPLTWVGDPQGFIGRFVNGVFTFIRRLYHFRNGW